MSAPNTARATATKTVARITKTTQKINPRQNIHPRQNTHPRQNHMHMHMRRDFVKNFTSLDNAGPLHDTHHRNAPESAESVQTPANFQTSAPATDTELYAAPTDLAEITVYDKSVVALRPDRASAVPVRSTALRQADVQQLEQPRQGGLLQGPAGG
ncbi:hypothetical protein LTR16_005494 [Cryomyces antarcticus]|uniref:Uncharacterized protein n=1 Tax=Cryomyces antarcticus TaxID=329879 RepID=A0ABR0KR86_9PEZI|nr:hypothetical protein LTR60_005404 [Cryomyces antarcticus]KAK5009153.1 hypothetical protein LTR39_004999 [Cryomyces antarcticus]KAK5111094.1 hypothetical protein LTR16_005494 [Cryomyces antarcticus]